MQAQLIACKVATVNRIAGNNQTKTKFKIMTNADKSMETILAYVESFGKLRSQVVGTEFEMAYKLGIIQEILRNTLNVLTPDQLAIVTLGMARNTELNLQVVSNAKRFEQGATV